MSEWTVRFVQFLVLMASPVVNLFQGRSRGEQRSMCWPRLCLEPLESRVVPADLLWVGLDQNNNPSMSASANWMNKATKAAAVPAAGDALYFVGAAPLAPNLKEDMLVSRIHVDSKFAQKIKFDANTVLQLSAGGNMDGGGLTGSGTLTIANGALFWWRGGTLEGRSRLNVVNGGNLSLEPGSTTRALIDSTLANAGTVLWTGGDFTMSNNALINNQGSLVVNAGKLPMKTYPSGMLNGDKTTKVLNLANGVLDFAVGENTTVEWNVRVENRGGEIHLAGGGTASLNWGGENSGLIQFRNVGTSVKPSTLRIGTPTVGGQGVNPSFVWKSGGSFAFKGGVNSGTFLVQGNSTTGRYPYLEVTNEMTIPSGVSLKTDYASIWGGRMILQSGAKGEQQRSWLTNTTLEIQNNATYTLSGTGADKNSTNTLSTNGKILNMGTLNLGGTLYFKPGTSIDNGGQAKTGRTNFRTGSFLRAIDDKDPRGFFVNNATAVVEGVTEFWGTDLIRPNPADFTINNNGKLGIKRVDSNGNERPGGSWEYGTKGKMALRLLNGFDHTDTRLTGLPGSRLEGEGTVVWQDVENQGTVAPGGDRLSGLLTFDGNFTQTAAGLLSLEFGGLGGSDSIKVNGSVTLAGKLATSILPDFSNSASSYTLIDNDDTDPVIGTFVGLPENYVVPLGGYDYRIKYGGGDGNDVVLLRDNSAPSRPKQLGDRVFLDLPRTGIQGFMHIGQPDVQVDLLDEFGDLVGSTLTGLNGDYGFYSVNPGLYQLRVVAPFGYHLSPANVGSNDLIDSDADPLTGLTHQFLLGSEDQDWSLDFGLVENQSPNAVSDWATVVVGGSVRIDVLANDSDPDGDPLTITDVTQAMYGSVSIDDNGTPDDPSDDQVVYTHTGMFPAPDGFGYTISDGNGGSTSGTVMIGVTPPAPTGSIGNHVWADTYDNGIQDPNEVGVPGVYVRLLDAQGYYLDSRFTDSTGAYSFDNLAVGDYLLEFSPPYGMGLVAKDQGTDDELDSDADPLTYRTDTITLSGNQNLNGWDAGLKVLSPDPGGEEGGGEEGGGIEPGGTGEGGTVGQTNGIMGRAWDDQDGDGIQDAGEVGIAGLTVTLRDASGNLVQTTTADANGYYRFASLAAGFYSVSFAAPVGQSFSAQNAGSDDTLDSDVDANGQSALVYIGSLDLVEHLDAGLLPSGGGGNNGTGGGV